MYACMWIKFSCFNMVLLTICQKLSQFVYNQIKNETFFIDNSTAHFMLKYFMIESLFFAFSRIFFTFIVNWVLSIFSFLFKTKKVFYQSTHLIWLNIFIFCLLLYNEILFIMQQLVINGSFLVQLIHWKVTKIRCIFIVRIMLNIKNESGIKWEENVHKWQHWVGVPICAWPYVIWWAHCYTFVVVCVCIWVYAKKKNTAWIIECDGSIGKKRSMEIVFFAIRKKFVFRTLC